MSGSGTYAILESMDEQLEEAEKTPNLLDQAKTTLEQNNQGDYTIPAPGLYPHQWLWDSCFIAIGLRHLDIERAQGEILSLLRGQWSNGMLPHIIFAKGHEHRTDRRIWRSWVSPYSPDDVATSGITQPPMLAEAVYRVGQRLKLAERRTWYQTVFPALLRYHQWLYNERDPHEEGLVLQIHSWETGMDNTPPWMAELREHLLPWWIRLIEKLHLQWIITLFRRDARFVHANERLSTIEALALYSVQRRLRRKTYDINRVLSHSVFAIEDVAFNSIFIRSNQILRDIAKTIRKDLPEDLIKQMRKTEEALEQLWDPYSSQYYSRNFVTHKFLKETSIATLLPLYAGCISKERASQLVKLIQNAKLYGPQYPVPSVAVNSARFKQHGYWQGPTWVNMNWLIIDGLERNGFTEQAEALKQSTLEMVQKSGLYEYFSPLDASPVGTNHFSWTAALTIDLLQK